MFGVPQRTAVSWEASSGFCLSGAVATEPRSAGFGEPASLRFAMRSEMVWAGQLFVARRFATGIRSQTASRSLG
jgi:hypothetical protein